MGRADSLAYLAAWQDTDGTWYPGAPLPGQETPFSRLVAVNGNGGRLQVIGLGRDDLRAYLAAWQDTEGTWMPADVFLP